MADNPHYLRFAYADPPYPGQSKRYYGDQPSYAGEVDHAALLERLTGYDGWALSTSVSALPRLMALCPDGVRVAVWHRADSPHPGARGRWWWVWEPVIVKPARLTMEDLGPVVADLLNLSWQVGTRGNARIVTGQKPPAFCRWVLDLLGYRDGDTLDDLFPGSGVMSRVAAQGQLL